MNAMKWLKNIVTGADNETHDLGRISWIGSFFAVVGTVAVNLWRGVSVDIQTLATALSVVAGAHGAALWAKKDTEPPPTK